MLRKNAERKDIKNVIVSNNDETQKFVSAVTRLDHD